MRYEIACQEISQLNRYTRCEIIYPDISFQNGMRDLILFAQRYHFKRKYDVWDQTLLSLRSHIKMRGEIWECLPRDLISKWGSRYEIVCTEISWAYLTISIWNAISWLKISYLIPYFVVAISCLILEVWPLDRQCHISCWCEISGLAIAYLISDILTLIGNL